MPDEILVDLKCAVWSVDRSQLRPPFSILLFLAGRFWRNKISVVTSDPALALTAVLGKRSAASSTAPSARWQRTVESCLSIVYRLVISAIRPPGRTTSRDLARK